jgi:probable F420-dependent oxidoreductase
MRFSTSIPGVFHYPPVSAAWEADMRPGDFQLVARTIDELGFDAIAVPEHIVMPTEMVSLMGSSWPHALTVMAFVAGATTRMIVDSSVIVLPYHHPVVLAKAVSTLDGLTGGRVRLSVGVGHAEREFEILDVPFHERGRMTDEYLAAMIELWTSDEPAYHGRFVDFSDVVFDPKPVQHPHPPIWVGGNSKAAMRRAVRHDGWYPWLITAADLPEQLEYLRSLPEFEARTAPLDVCMPLVPLAVDEQHRRTDMTGRTTLGRDAQAHVDAVGELAEIGVTWTSVAVPPARSLDEHIDSLCWFSDVLGLRRLDDRA